MTEKRFRYERSTWCSNPERARSWYDTLERMSPVDVRALLAQSGAGPGGSVAIGTEVSMTRGFAEEWLAWHDRRKAERKDSFRHTQVRWLRWAVIVTAIVGAVGWLLAWLK